MPDTPGCRAGRPAAPGDVPYGTAGMAAPPVISMPIREPEGPARQGGALRRRARP